MDRSLNEDFISAVLAIVDEIPPGTVATYGQIARLIGHEKNARLVGRALSLADSFGEYPCHRVVDHAGRLVPGWKNQRRLLADEGVFLKDDDHVDLKRYQWQNDCSY